VITLTMVIVAAGGAAGAAVRYLVDLAVTARMGSRFPWATLVVNVTGSFLLGVLAGAVSETTILAAAGAGLLGGYTTFSAVNAAAATLILAGRVRAAVLSILANAAGAVAAAAAGLAVGMLLAG
jgi:CrcB protein